MNISTLMEHINMPAPMAEMVIMEWASLKLMLSVLPLKQLMEDEDGLKAYHELATVLGDDPLGVKHLTCQLYCACVRYETYFEKKIPDHIYFETMSCYTRFVTECLYYKGSYQFDRGWWTWRQISMRVFRLGQLEYELRSDGTVAMHIPSDANLSGNMVDQSIMIAKDFLYRYFPDYNNADFTCNSWLLSPNLKHLLSERSNILAFQKRFQLTNSDPDAKDFICWLFQRPSDVAVADLPENTTLQCNVKAWLLAGGKIGNAAGYLTVDKE